MTYKQYIHLKLSLQMGKQPPFPSLWMELKKNVENNISLFLMWQWIEYLSMIGIFFFFINAPGYITCVENEGHDMNHFSGRHTSMLLHFSCFYINRILCWLILFHMDIHFTWILWNINWKVKLNFSKVYLLAEDIFRVMKPLNPFVSFIWVRMKTFSNFLSPCQRIQDNIRGTRLKELDYRSCMEMQSGQVFGPQMEDHCFPKKRIKILVAKTSEFIVKTKFRWRVVHRMSCELQYTT